ncbi:redox-active disulfide protein 2 [Flavobacterium sp.]|jgi:hypothetical protein|uniref:redox-active disulfide protein 2 n=1 Tax=Flavobacterium sp. TaxID=239 RepID=UPI0037BEA1CB
MKKQPDLSQLSVEELNKRAKMTKTATIMFGVVLLLQFAIGVYLTLKNGFNVFIIIPVAFLPLMIINMSSLKSIKDELAKRES